MGDGLRESDLRAAEHVITGVGVVDLLGQVLDAPEEGGRPLPLARVDHPPRVLDEHPFPRVYLRLLRLQVVVMVVGHDEDVRRLRPLPHQPPELGPRPLLDGVGRQPEPVRCQSHSRVDDQAEIVGLDVCRHAPYTEALEG